jgi:hypothetical protein
VTTKTGTDHSIVLDYIDVIANRLDRQDLEARRAASTATGLAIFSIVLAVVLWLVPPLRFWEHDPSSEEAAARVERAAEVWLEQDLSDGDVDWWVERTSHGADIEISGMLSAPDSVIVDPGEATPDEFIDSLQHVMEDKEPGSDQPGWRYWRNQLDRAMQAAGGDGRTARLAVGRDFIEVIAAGG